jgi:hypothetical protein
MRIRITAIPKAQMGLDNQGVPPAELEAGEIYSSTEGTINKISDKGNTHEDGGEIVLDADRILEDTSDKRTDVASKNLKVLPEELKDSFGVTVKKPVTHSKAFEIVSAYYEKKAKKIENVLKKNKKSINWNDKYAENSLNINAKNLQSIPTDQSIFDTLFEIQEAKKAPVSQEGMPMAQYGWNNKVLNSAVDYAKKHPKGVGMQPSYQAPPPILNDYNADLQWFNTAGPLMGIMDSARRGSTQYFGQESSPYTPKYATAEPYLQRNQSDYNAAIQGLDGTGIGNANRANLYAQKWLANQQAFGQVDQMNTSIGNTAAAAEATRRTNQSANNRINMGDFDNRFLSSIEAQRLQKNTSWDNLFSTIGAHNKHLTEGDLIMSMYQYFNQQGDYNGNQVRFNNGFGKSNKSSSDVETIPIRSKYNALDAYVTTLRDQRGNRRAIRTEQPPKKTATFR